jgi:hypothetical protein
MLEGISTYICRGYTGADHLIGSSDEKLVADSIVGLHFRRAADAYAAAERAYRGHCDRRVSGAPIEIVLRRARGDYVVVRGGTVTYVGDECPTDADR